MIENISINLSITKIFYELEDKFATHPGMITHCTKQYE